MGVDSRLKQLNVLVVDDEVEMRRALIFDFKRRGCVVFEAANGSAAFEIVRTNKIDIVISDVRMPNGDGISLLKKIRELDPGIPIVLLATGFADLTESEARGMGANALLEKPIDRKRMLAILEGLVFPLLSREA